MYVYIYIYIYTYTYIYNVFRFIYRPAQGLRPLGARDDGGDEQAGRPPYMYLCMITCIPLSLSTYIYIYIYICVYIYIYICRETEV